MTDLNHSGFPGYCIEPVFTLYYVEDSARKYHHGIKGATPDAASDDQADALASSLRARQVFGANLRRARRLQNMSQKQLADLAGVSRSYFGEVEHGLHNICINRMERIAAALELPLQALLDAEYFTLAGYRRRN